MGLIDKNDDGHVSIGEASFAHLQYDEYEKAREASRRGDDRVGCGGFVLYGCLGVVALFAVIALLAWLVVMIFL